MNLSFYVNVKFLPHIFLFIKNNNNNKVSSAHQDFRNKHDPAFEVTKVCGVLHQLHSLTQSRLSSI